MFKGFFDTRTDLRLDLTNEVLLRGCEEYPVRPKTFAVLRHLVSRPGQLVSKSQLLDSVWTDSYVSDMVLKVSICELRKALGDDPRDPRYIRTHHGRGYRFIGHLDVPAVPDRQPRCGPDEHGMVDLRPRSQILREESGSDGAGAT